MSTLAKVLLLLMVLISQSAIARLLEIYPGEATGMSIGGYLAVNRQLHRDASATSLADASFTPIDQAVANFGIGQPPVWLRLTIINTTPDASTRVLSLNRALLDDLKVLLVRADKVEEILTTEDRLHSYAQYATMAAPFELRANEQAALYIYYQGPNSSILPLSIETPESLESRNLLRLILFFSSLAGVLTLVIYNAMLAVISRMPAFLYYSAAQSAMFLYFMHLSGVTTIYLWPETPEVGNTLAPILAVLTCILNVRFVQSFVTFKHLPVWLWRILNLIMAIGLLHLALSTLKPIFDVVNLSILASLVTVLTIVSLPLSGLYACAGGRFRYLPMTIAWVWFSLCITFTTLGFFNLLPVVPAFVESYLGFAFFEATLLATSLALAVKHMEQERIRTQASLAKSLAAELEESKKAEQLMRERTIALDDLADRGRLLQAVGHDTRQSLFSLRQFAGGLNSESSPARLETARQSINKLVDHLDDVLATTLAGAHGGAMVDQVLAFEKVSFHDLLEPIRLIYQRMASQRGLRLLIHPGKASVVTDRVLMIRILSNLVNNAVKYTSRGGIVVGCRSFGHSARIQVWDTGVGLKPAQLDHLLNAESHSIRYDNAGEGQGSGFQIVRSLANNLGVAITARSTPHRGSVFECHFPDVPAPAETYRCYLLDEDPLTETWLKNAGLEVLKNLPESSDLPVFVDFDYQGTAKGIKMADQLKSHFPKVILTSFDHAADIRSAVSGSAKYLAYKPLQPEAVLMFCAHATQPKIQ